MRRLAAGLVVLTSSWLLTGCGGGGAGGVANSITGGAAGVASVTQPQSAQAEEAQIAGRYGPRGSTNIEALVHAKVKHVFVLIQENHTFDSYFGLFPGVNGQSVENLASATARADDCEPDPVAGGCQRPFLISANPRSPNYVADAPDITGGANDRNDQEAGIDHGRMDGFLSDIETGTPPLGPTPSPAQIQAHNEAIGIEGVYDCDTVPYLWYYAKNFALFDHYFQADTGQSTPGNIQLFAGQIGQTEAAAGEGTPLGPRSGRRLQRRRADLQR